MLARRRHQPLCLVLLIALFLATVGPWLPRLLVSAKRYDSVEICTSTGLRRISLPASGTPTKEQAPDDVMVLGHCPFCLIAKVTGLPPADPVSLRVVPPSTSAPTVWRLDANAESITNPAARPRGPPGTAAA